MDNAMIDADPLSTYQPQEYPQVPYQPPLSTPMDTDYLPTIAQEMAEQNEQSIVEEEDIKPDIKALEAAVNKQKKPRTQQLKGRTSSCWNERITDKDFPFYGCSICDISFKEIGELDQHVTTHSDRITTYKLKKINLKKRKQLEKQKKTLRKEAKVKKEMEIAIKPEDGYIGADKASDFDKDSKYDVKNVPDGIENSTASNLDSKNDNDKNIERNKKISPIMAKSENEKKYVHAYKCFACKKLFALSYYLKLHVRSHTGEKPYTCSECGKSFITASDLGRHRKRIHLATKHQCRICFEIFTKFEMLVKHFDSNHQADKLEGEPYDYNAIVPYIKQEQEDQFNKETEDTKPKTEETKPKLEDIQPKTEDPCNIPPVTDSGGQSSMVDIQIKVEFDEIKQETVDDDDQNDDNDDHGSSDHGVKDDDTDDDDFNDKDTGSDEEYIPSKTWARPHSPLIKNKEKSEQSFQCPICEKIFNRKLGLKYHLRTHTGEKPFRCVDCNRSFAYKNSYKRHIVDHHSNTTPKNEILKPKDEPKIETPDDYEVPIEPIVEVHETVKDSPPCDEENMPSGASVPAQSPQPEPTSQTATRSKVPVCPICHKQVSSTTYLAVHMRTHTGEKPFSCYVCGRSFMTASMMRRHVLRMHDESWQSKEETKPDDSADFKPEIDAKVKLEDGAEGKSEDDAVKKPEVVVEWKSNTAMGDIKLDKEFIEKAKAKMLLKQTKRQFFGKKDGKKEEKGSKLTHSCDICYKKFRHRESMQVHRNAHGKNATMLCRFCSREYTDVEARNDCEDSHNGPKPYQCKLCSRQYTKKGKMVLHRKKCNGVDPADERKKFLCEICNKSYTTHTILQRHLATHGSQYSVRYECPICAHIFHTRYHVKMHLRTHMKEGLISDENREAVLATVLQNARKIPKTPEAASAALLGVSVDERSRICNICGQIFQNFFCLEEHLKIHGSKIALEEFNDDEEEKKHTCQVCSKSFKLAYYLKLHSFTHSNEKSFVCQLCGKGFKTKSVLRRHQQTHQEQKKHQCHICLKFFSRASYLRIHVRTVHGTQDYSFREFGIDAPMDETQVWAPEVMMDE